VVRRVDVPDATFVSDMTIDPGSAATTCTSSRIGDISTPPHNVTRLGRCSAPPQPSPFFNVLPAYEDEMMLHSLKQFASSELFDLRRYITAGAVEGEAEGLDDDEVDEGHVRSVQLMDGFLDREPHNVCILCLLNEGVGIPATLLLLHKV
jgi:hypothetical protein